MQIEIVGSYSGKVDAGGQYESQQPFSSIKMIAELPDNPDFDERAEIDRLTQICYESFLDWREQTLLDLNTAKWFEHNNHSSIENIEQVRLVAIQRLKEHGQWFRDNDRLDIFKGLYENYTKQPLNAKNGASIDNLPFGMVRVLERQAFNMKERMDK